MNGDGGDQPQVRARNRADDSQDTDRIDRDGCDAELTGAAAQERDRGDEVAHANVTPIAHIAMMSEPSLPHLPPPGTARNKISEPAVPAPRIHPAM